MSGPIIYRFDDVSIFIDAQNGNLCDYINEYCYLTKTEEMQEKTISITYREDDQADIGAVIPADAALNFDVPFEMEGVSRLKRFSRAGAESWSVYEGYGSVYCNYDTREIAIVLGNGGSGLDITGFIVLFIHPVIRALGSYGYHRLHAACLKVGARNILITGQSGRGKSTATFALANRGHQVLSDEMPLLRKTDRGFCFYALFNMVKLRWTALERFFGDFDRIRFRKGEDCYIKLSDLNQTGLEKLEGIQQLFILKQTGQDDTEIETISCLEVVPEMFPVSLSIMRDQQAEKDFQALMDLLDTVECYQVCFGTDPDLFTERMEKMTVSK